MPPASPKNDPLFGNPASDLLRGAMEPGAAASSAASDRIEWVPPSVRHLGEMLPGYEVQALLGRGGMGAVYRAVQLSLQRPVAIKLLPAELAASADFMSRFEREAQTLARLQHPGIVAVHDFGRTAEGHLYFVMEHVAGTDLERIIQGPGLDAEQALNLTLQICEALQYAHSQGVVHRDIKPANVLLTQDGRAKLADFGLARPLSRNSGLTAASLVIGTPEYMAPEQWAGKVDHRADIYALGVMLYEMLTGTRPQGVFDPPSECSHVDARLDEVVVKAMRQAPEQRYQNVSELRDAVASIRDTPPPRPASSKLAPQPASSRPKTAARRSRSKGRSNAWTWVGLGLLVAVSIALGLLNRSYRPVSSVADKSSSRPAEPVTPDIPATPASSPAAPAIALEDAPKAALALLSRKEADPNAGTLPVAAVTPGLTPEAPAMQGQSPPISTPVTPPPAPPPAVIEVFSRESQNLIAWALSPLEAEIPDDIRQNLTFIREDLIDEGKIKPTASLDAYRTAFYLCEDLLTTLNERDKVRAAAGFRAAQVTADQNTSTQALDARRNYLMSWPQYEREQSQRSALTQQNQARTAVATEAQKVAWTTTSSRLRTTLDTRYRAFRAALRQ